MWSTPASIKSTSASIKKFYRFLADREIIDKELVQEMLEEFRECLPEWQERCARYNDPHVKFDEWDFF